MIEVVFILRTPGNHHEIDRRVMPCVPREGEMVADSEEVTAHRVHSVMYVLSATDYVARVYLDDDR